MIFINKNQIDLSMLIPSAPTGGKNYRGGDEVMAMIASKWQELYDKYGATGTITFIRPHMKSGYGQGSMGGSYQRSVHIQTRTGTRTVTWCETAVETNNGLNFLPKTFTHSPEQSLILSMERNIEQILWHCLFDQLRNRKYTYPLTDPTGKPHPKAGKQVSGIYILDPEDDAKTFILNAAKQADLMFYLTSPNSPILTNRDILNKLASVWGLFKPEMLSDAVLRQNLLQAVESAQNLNEADKGYEAFSKAVQLLMQGLDTDNLDAMALVSRASDRGVIKYYASEMAWHLMGEGNVKIKKLCNVPASKSTRPKEVMADFLLHNDDDMSMISTSVDSIVVAPKEPKKHYIPPNPSRDFFTNMTFPKQRSICNIIGIDFKDKTKKQLADDLIQHFIILGKVLPPENLLSEPEE